MLKSLRPLLASRHLISLATLVCAPTAYGGVVINSAIPVFEAKPESKSGLNTVYVFRSLADVSISYLPASSEPTEWLEYDTNGSAATACTDLALEDGKYVLRNPRGDRGYIITNGSQRISFWIVDYSKSPFVINSLAQSSEIICESTVLEMDGNASPIYYYGLTGTRFNLSREIKVTYDNQEWNENADDFSVSVQEKELGYISGIITLTPPLYCDSKITLTGDVFQRFWNEETSYQSDVITAMAVASRTWAKAEDTDNDASNVIPVSVTDLGGSGPVTVDFSSVSTDKVMHNEWQIASDEEFEDVLFRIYEDDFSFTFSEEGTKYIRYIGSNADGTCETYGDVYNVTVGASELRIPNAFSPDGDGINDEWKVSYRSLVDFKCTIFNRQGHQIFSFSNPSMGWDGTKNGKKVADGVYFYVITATGTDGRRYNKSGDINILGTKSGIGTLPAE